MPGKLVANMNNVYIFLNFDKEIAWFFMHNQIRRADERIFFCALFFKEAFG